jgi:hypothetical protein
LTLATQHRRQHRYNSALVDVVSPFQIGAGWLVLLASVEPFLQTVQRFLISYY